MIISPANLGVVTILAGLTSALVTFGLIRLSPQLRWSSVPRGDRWHSQATPNSGGVAIFASCALAYAVALRGAYTPVAAGAVAIFLLGFLDDRLRLGPGKKILAQCAIAAFVVSSGIVFPATSWAWANWIFSFLWIIGLTNSFNLIDNMDGLCAGVTVVICVFRVIAMSLTNHPVDAGLAAIVAAAFAGFLIFNYHPARIFMGDCGSMLAGFLLSASTIASSEAYTKAFAAAFFYPALTFTYPIFDTLLVSCLRRSAGRPISVGGRDHSSHRLAYLGLNQRRVVWILWGLTALGSAIGLLTHWMPLAVVGAAAVLTAGLSMFGIFLSTLPPYQIPKDSPALGSLLRRRIPTLRAGIILLVDALLSGIALFFSFLAVQGSNFLTGEVRVFVTALPVVMFCHGLMSCVHRTFDISWQWFSNRDAMRLARTILMSGGAAWLGLFALGTRLPASTILLYVIVCLALVSALRSSLRTLQILFERPSPERERVGIFGASTEGEMLANLLRKHTFLNATPVLFLDYDRSKEGMCIHGIPVRCCATNLRDLAGQFRFESVLIVGPFENSLHANVTRDGVKAGVRTRMLDITIRDLDGPVFASPGLELR